MNKQAFAVTLETLAECYRVVLTEAATRGYWIGVEDLTDAEFQAAAKQALRECEFMPAPAQLRKLALKFRRALEPTEIEKTDRRLEAMRPSWWNDPNHKGLSEWRNEIKKLAEMKSEEPS